jgi:COP9 signalosome complex subunit 1
LFLIGQSSIPLCVEALKAAVVEAKAGNDVNRYRDAWDALRTMAPEEPEAQRDDAWIDRIETANKAETARLEGELKGYRNNLIKESIRVRTSLNLSGITYAHLLLMVVFDRWEMRILANTLKV